MKKWYVIEKKLGETPLQALERLREQEEIESKVPMTYSGRLDPMAEGKLLILVGDECKRRAEYDGLDKEYYFEGVFGLSTDTGDVLGLPSVLEDPGIVLPTVHQVCRDTIGPLSLTYPLFSSKPVGGKPLFMHAHEGTHTTIEIPTAPVRIFRLRCGGIRTLSSEEFLSEVRRKLSLLSAPKILEKPESDFRIGRILKQWESVSDMLPTQITVFSFFAIVSSGTYIRALVPHIASRLHTTSFAFSIVRTRIGRFIPRVPTVNLWSRSF